MSMKTVLGHTYHCEAQPSYFSPMQFRCVWDRCGPPLFWIKATAGRLLVCAWHMCCGICMPPPLQNHVHKSSLKPLSRLYICLCQGTEVSFRDLARHRLGALWSVLRTEPRV